LAKGLKGINKLLNKFTKEELVNILGRFYVEAQSHDGICYSRNSTRAIRAGMRKTLASVLLLTEFNPQMMLSILTWSRSLSSKKIRPRNTNGVDTSGRRNSLQKQAAWARDSRTFTAYSLVLHHAPLWKVWARKQEGDDS